MTPLAPDRYKVTFTATADTCEKLELAKDLLRHAIPSGDPAQIVARALDALIDQLVRQKFAVTSRPRGSHGHAEDSRHIPAEVKRAVYVRDRGRCAFVGVGGHRCGNRAFLEFHQSGSLRGRWPGHRGQHRASLPRAQRSTRPRCSTDPSGVTPWARSERRREPHGRVMVDAFRSGTKAAGGATVTVRSGGNRP